MLCPIQTCILRVPYNTALVTIILKLNDNHSQMQAFNTAKTYVHGFHLLGNFQLFKIQRSNHIKCHAIFKAVNKILISTLQSKSYCGMLVVWGCHWTWTASLHLRICWRAFFCTPITSSHCGRAPDRLHGHNSQLNLIAHTVHWDQQTKDLHLSYKGPAMAG